MDCVVLFSSNSADIIIPSYGRETHSIVICGVCYCYVFMIPGKLGTNGWIPTKVHCCSLFNLLLSYERAARAD